MAVYFVYNTSTLVHRRTCVGVARRFRLTKRVRLLPKKMSAAIIVNSNLAKKPRFAPAGQSFTLTGACHMSHVSRIRKEACADE
jgi:hypothetical protein